MNEPFESLARQLILDELFDLTLYVKLQTLTSGVLKKVFEELITVETRHFNFWKKFFKIEISQLDLKRRLKLVVLTLACRIFGSTAIHLVLEAIEIYGVRKYLMVWEEYKDQPLGRAIREILNDEFEHEDTIVSQMSERKINPERIRSVFLGLNDGLVEILGAVSGFFAAFSHAGMVLMAGFSVSVAGAISMAAGAFVASSAEKEVEGIERGKAKFFGRNSSTEKSESQPLNTSFIVGISYLLGAMIPMIPVLFGAKTVVISIISASIFIVFVSVILAFLSGMNVKKRTIMNLLIIAGAVGVSYMIGSLAKKIWGINL